MPHYQIKFDYSVILQADSLEKAAEKAALTTVKVMTAPYILAQELVQEISICPESGEIVPKPAS